MENIKTPTQMPGLVDLQINGFAGIDFNRSSLRSDEVETACRLLRDEGVVAFLPTLITNDSQAVKTLIPTILSATTGSVGDVSLARILGLHLEGPFISPQSGARGAHPAEWIRPPDLDWVRRMNDLAEGRVRLLTFSPEWDDSPRFVEAVCAMGIKVAIGHTLADRQQIADAASAGATLSTHLGNGIPAMLPRHPNPIWSQLSEDGLWCSLIGDGFHLPGEVFRSFMKIKGAKSFLVSDATEFTGMPPGRYESPIGGDVVLTPEGKLHLADDASLMAGSAMSLRRMVETVSRLEWLSFEEAWELASERPWRYLEEPGTPEIIDLVP